MSSVPFLPVVVNSTKDAARAAKDTAGLMIQAVTKMTLTQLLDLSEFVVVAYSQEQRGEGEILHLYCEHRNKVAMCPRCGKISTEVHEQKQRCARDLDIWGKRTFLHFPSRRFDCQECKRPFTEPLACVEPWRRQTRRFGQYIYQRCRESSRKAVAEEAGLHEATVKDIFIRWARRATRRQRTFQVRLLGIDEIALKKHHKQYALVLSDLERRCVIAVLPERKKARLEQWFDDLSAVEQKAIGVVSIDMWDPFRQAVRDKLPHAQLVADRFHVMKQLNDRLTQMRRAIQREADKDTRQVLKGSRWLLVKNRDELTAEERAQLREVLAASPRLRTLYLLKEEFRTIYEKMRHRQQAERFLRAWLYKADHTGDPFLAKFIQTLRNWWDEILSYFEDRVTNGFVEGMNRAIRTIIARAYGYRNFENFRLQILAQHGPPVLLSHYFA